jgi:hypothetical protein
VKARLRLWQLAQDWPAGFDSFVSKNNLRPSRSIGVSGVPPSGAGCAEAPLSVTAATLCAVATISAAKTKNRNLFNMDHLQET